jgi:hypothetical protein
VPAGIRQGSAVGHDGVGLKPSTSHQSGVRMKIGTPPKSAKPSFR